MNLSDYINLTLKEIAIGAQKASETYQSMGKGCVLSETSAIIDGVPHVKLHKTSKPIISVTFRVAIELEEAKEVNGGIGGSIKVITANAGSINKEGKKSVQEITFDMPVLLPSVKI